MKKSNIIKLGTTITLLSLGYFTKSMFFTEKIDSKESSVDSKNPNIVSEKNDSKASGAEKKKTNVIFIMSDEHSPHALHIGGNNIIKTPNLDSLAHRGVLFANSYCQNPICVPSRVSLITGKMPSNANTFENDGGLPKNIDTMADVFIAGGYQAEWIGKQHWGGESGFGNYHKEVSAVSYKKGIKPKNGRLPHDAEISDWNVERNHETIITDFALKYIDNNKDKPFFLGVSYPKPHFPFSIQQQYYDLYKDVIDVPKVTPEMLEQLPALSKSEYEKYGLANLTDEQIAKARAVYYGMVTYVDEQIGRILKKIDEAGLSDNTIIVYTSDHGELAGEHGLWYKNSFYEGSVRVPTIISFPSQLPQNKKIDALSMNIDLFPTLCELTGLKIPEGVEGTSLVKLMMGQEDGADRIAVSENYRGRTYTSKMIRQGKFKYCWYDTGEQQLFNLEDDLEEVNNLANDPKYEELISELKTKVFQYSKYDKPPAKSKKNQKMLDDDE